MTDFKAAFANGLKAAKEARVARQEIGQVFKDLNKQLSEVSKGKLKIERQQFEVKTPGILKIITPFQPRPTYWAVAAINPKVKNSSPKELAKWLPDRAGYPCKISWGDREQYCEDKQALEICLADLLSDPIIAEKLSALMKIKATGEDETRKAQ